MIKDHLFELLFEFDISFVKCNLHALLESRIIDSYLILKVLKLTCQSRFNDLKLFSHELCSIFIIFFHFIQ